MVSVFNSWKQFEVKYQELMRAQLERIVATQGLSPNVFEITSKAVQF